MVLVVLTLPLFLQPKATFDLSVAAQHQQKTLAYAVKYNDHLSKLHLHKKENLTTIYSTPIYTVQIRFSVLVVTYKVFQVGFVDPC